MPWTAKDIPDQSGRTVLVTGANSGIGLEACRAFARAGARVILACRDFGRAETSCRDILETVPAGRLEVRQLNVGSLDSIVRFAESLMAEHDRLDVLVNNAGIMGIPRAETPDGFEMVFGVNHLGAFALTGRLLPLVLTTAGSRVISHSSVAHRQMRAMNFKDLHGVRNYARQSAYSQSKLANLLFMFELDRRLRAAGASTLSVACHPGIAKTNIFTAASETLGWSVARALVRLYIKTASALLFQSPADGALPMLYAATAPDVVGGEFYGPSGFNEWWGSPRKTEPREWAKDVAAAERLWRVSEELTGVRYDLPVPRSVA